VEAKHDLTFQRYGRSYHLAIRHSEDLRRVLTLDEGHWLATGAPVTALNLDPPFLAYVDYDGNGRIMCFEVRAAIEWLLANLSDHNGINIASPQLQLDCLNTTTQDGKRIQEAARKILRQLDKQDSPSITLEDVRAVKTDIEARPTSEAGVILPEAVTDEDTRQFVRDIIATVGGVDHPGGKQGVDQARLDEFLTQAQAHLDWLAESEPADGDPRTDIMPLGDDTAEAVAAYSELKEKLDQYFAQCEAVAFDERALPYLLLGEDDLKTADLADPRTVKALMLAAPIASPSPQRTLPLEEEINPAYQRAIETFRELAAEPALGRSVPSLGRADWEAVKTFFAAHDEWQARKAGAAVDLLGKEQLKTYLSPAYRTAVESAIEDCAETALALDSIRLVEKLILYQANMIAFVNNFVSFPYLYDPGTRAAFEMGTLVVDGRRLTLAVKVDNRAEHARIAGASDIFVIYADILDTGGNPKYTVAVPVTSGGRGNVGLGKRGVFQTVDGEEFDARIVQIIENPISITETLVAPLHRLGKLLSGRIEAMTAAAEKKLDATAGAALDQAQAAKPAPAPSAQSRGLFAGGILMGGGVALAALSSAVAYVSATLDKIGPYKIAGGVLLALLAVVAPASILALLKLRRRDLSAILEGSGWAINARMRLTFRQGKVFTFAPRYPEGSRGIVKRWQLALLWTLIAALIAALIRAVQIMR